MLGTTEPTRGTGLEMRGDMEGMLDSWVRSVTLPPSDSTLHSVYEGVGE